MDSLSATTAPQPQAWWLGRRFLLGGLLIVALTAVTTAAAGLNEVGKLGKAIRQNPRVAIGTKVLEPSAPGRPQTLLLVGDDRRPAHPGSHAVTPHSNEMLLVRLDPARRAIAMLSIPRDLRVTILPRHGRATVGRINTAYTIGGIELMTQTIKRVLGVSVNHVVVITFPNFRRAVDEMGCVYSTVDHRYYHSNVGVPPGQRYFEINLQPGYQRLCGRKALEFVSYRHGDTALVRDARDQSFLRDVKAQYGPKLLDNRDKFERIFGKAVLTDVRSDSDILRLFELLVRTAGSPIRQVPFKAHLGPRFVTATRQQINGSVRAFLHGGEAPPTQRIAATAKAVRRRRGARFLVRTPGTDLSRGRAAGRRLPFALEYPRLRDQSGAHPDAVRTYGIRDPQGRVHLAYAIAIDRGRVGESYDVQGTSWADPPLLDHPDQTVQVGARQYALYYEGDHLKTLAWREGRGVYWINNTLVDSLSPRSMLAMAVQTTPVSVPAVRGPRPPTAPRRFLLPKRSASELPDGLAIAGAIAGFAALAVIGLFAALLLRRARDLAALRAECEHAKRAQARAYAAAR